MSHVGFRCIVGRQVAMTVRTPTRSKVVMAKLALVLVVVIATVGLAWYGISSGVREQLLLSMFDRPGGPMTFRFVLQPAVATLLAALDGVKDARNGPHPTS